MKFNFDKLILEYKVDIDNMNSILKLIRIQKTKNTTLNNSIVDINLEDIESGINFTAFLSISMLDLVIILKHFGTSKNESEKYFFIKQGYLLINEVLTTYNKHGKKINKLIETKYKDLASTQSGLSHVIKEFKSINKYDTYIKMVRNNVAGHISEDFEQYYNIINNFDQVASKKTFEHFIIVLKAMQVLSRKISRNLSLNQNLNSIIKQ